jgi:hypothetical protein
MLLISAFIPTLALVAANGMDDPEESSSVRSPRSRASLLVDGSEIRTITGSKPYDSVLVKDNGTLVINGTLSTIDGTGRFVAKNNATIIINNYGILSTRYIYATCLRFELLGGVIDKGYDISIHTREPILMSSGAKIDCKGELGAGGAKGDDVAIEIESNKFVIIKEASKIECTGGRGSNGIGSNTAGSEGGNADIKIKANGTDADGTSINISQSTVRARGGNGGDGDYYYDGGSGGNADVDIVSKDKVIFDRCTEIGAYSGLGGYADYSQGEQALVGDATVTIECDQLFVDEYKKFQQQHSTSDASTKIISSNPVTANAIITIKAPKGAYLYYPNIEHYYGHDYKVLKASGASTVINIYNIVQIKVQSNNKKEIPDAAITISEGSTIVGSGMSNQQGNEFFMSEFEAYRMITNNKEPVAYNGKAVLNSATGEKSFTAPDRVNIIEIEIVLVSVEITELVFGGKSYTPKDGLKVAGKILIKGTASPSGLGKIVSVKLNIDKNTESILFGEDTTDTSNDDSYTTWEFELDASDTSQYEFDDKDILMVTATATDGVFDNSDDVSLEIKHDIIPRAPIVILKAPTAGEVDDAITNGIVISGTAYDPDRNSVRSDSKDIVSINIIIQDANGTSILTEPISLTLNKGLFYNESSNDYEWRTTWYSRIWKANTLYKYPAGIYTIYVTAKDNTIPTALTSEERSVEIELTHSGIPPTSPPTAVVKTISAIENGERSGFSFDEFSNTVIYSFLGDKGADEVKLRFDLSDSYDQDGEKADLSYFIETSADTQPGQYQKVSLVEKEIFEGEAGVKTYTATVKVKDLWGMENKNLQVVEEGTENNLDVTTITIKIEFREADPPQKGPLAFLFSLPLSYMEVYITLIILLVVFNIAAFFMIQSKYKKINKRRKARELALDTARKKQKSEEDKGDMYSHIQYVEEEGSGTGQVAVAGASVLSEEQTASQLETVEDLTKPAEPEAPQLVSVDQEAYELATTEQKPSEITPVSTATPAPAPTPAVPAAATAVPTAAPTPQAQPQAQVQAQPQPAQAQPAVAKPTQPQVQQKKEDE